ncbi:XTP/dITP diphosphatase [Velocimicrobium porci]|uniref:dITP/XTP pyrophosphatase n=1 Tax=Velocimicrobium porci TaxID=2606634 RepID=A0A6L5XVD0_9FIRM|nr:XTP/dITP diphosphatase [Velocimicrobium porci]MSS62775.1 XTP/dITP diphosphatase [Velocimicrobium porci]
MENRRLIFATGNEGKMKEIRMILGDLGYDIVSLNDLHLDIEIEENGTTFEENAIIKAKTIMEATNEMVMADDSGLEVDYLDKAPGVYSARYMGENTPYTVKNHHIMHLLREAKDEQRTARFVSVIACVFPNGEVITTEGTIEGRIGYEEKGENGFGYDPIFYLPEFGCTIAQLTLEQKNEISHRGKALRKMRERLEEKRGL